MDNGPASQSHGQKENSAGGFPFQKKIDTQAEVSTLLPADESHATVAPPFTPTATATGAQMPTGGFPFQMKTPSASAVATNAAVPSLLPAEGRQALARPMPPHFTPTIPATKKPTGGFPFHSKTASTAAAGAVAVSSAPPTEGRSAMAPPFTSGAPAAPKKATRGFPFQKKPPVSFATPAPLPADGRQTMAAPFHPVFPTPAKTNGGFPFSKKKPPAAAAAGFSASRLTDGRQWSSAMPPPGNPAVPTNTSTRLRPIDETIPLGTTQEGLLQRPNNQGSVPTSSTTTTSREEEQQSNNHDQPLQSPGFYGNNTYNNNSTEMMAGNHQPMDHPPPRPPTTPAAMVPVESPLVNAPFRGTLSQFDTSLVSPEHGDKYVEETTHATSPISVAVGKATGGGGMSLNLHQNDDNKDDSFEEVYQSMMSNQLLFDDGIKSYDEKLLDLSCLLCMEHGNMLAFEETSLNLIDELDEIIEMVDKEIAAVSLS
jgi:hypothetical protein